MLVQPPGIGRGHIKSNTTCRRRFFNADDHIQDYGAYPLMSVLSVPHYRKSPVSRLHGSSFVRPCLLIRTLFNHGTSILVSQEYEMTSNTYTQIQHPVPSAAYANYPFFTPGGGDRRWISSPANEDNLHWVGPLMYVPCHHWSLEPGRSNPETNNRFYPTHVDSAFPRHLHCNPLLYRPCPTLFC